MNLRGLPSVRGNYSSGLMYSSDSVAPVPPVYASGDALSRQYRPKEGAYASLVAGTYRLTPSSLSTSSSSSRPLVDITV